MHKNFGEWYRLVAIEPDGAQLQKRWAGVEAWEVELRKDDKNVLETVRIFQGPPSKVSMQPFLAVFQNQDSAFPQRNGLELQVSLVPRSSPAFSLSARMARGFTRQSSLVQLWKHPAFSSPSFDSRRSWVRFSRGFRRLQSNSGGESPSC